MSEAFAIIADSRVFQAALRRGPKALAKHMGRAIERSLLEIGRTARRDAPKAFSTLTHSIYHEMVSPFEGTVGPHVDYAEMVERGTGPGGRPPHQSLFDWIRVHRIVPRDEAMDEDDLAFVMARAIAHRGTPPQPYLIPAAEAHRAAVEQRLEAAIAATLNEVAR